MLIGDLRARWLVSGLPLQRYAWIIPCQRRSIWQYVEEKPCATIFARKIRRSNIRLPIFTVPIKMRTRAPSSPQNIRLSYGGANLLNEEWQSAGGW